MTECDCKAIKFHQDHGRWPMEVCLSYGALDDLERAVRHYLECGFTLDEKPGELQNLVNDIHSLLQHVVAERKAAAAIVDPLLA